MPFAPRTFHYKASIAAAEAAKREEHRRTARFAKRLGVTPVGLRELAKAAAGDGTLRGGMARLRLIEQGHATPDTRELGAYVQSHITDTGRAIVKQARDMGW